MKIINVKEYICAHFHCNKNALLSNDKKDQSKKGKKLFPYYCK